MLANIYIDGRLVLVLLQLCPRGSCCSSCECCSSCPVLPHRSVKQEVTPMKYSFVTLVRVLCHWSSSFLVSLWWTLTQNVQLLNFFYLPYIYRKQTPQFCFHNIMFMTLRVYVHKAESGVSMSYADHEPGEWCRVDSVKFQSCVANHRCCACRF